MICRTPSILIVDHDVQARLGLVDVLMRAEWPVVVATTLKRALECWSLHPFDAVLMDVIASGKAGLDAVQDVRRRWPQCVIVATSGGGLRGPKARALASADAIISKPLPDAKVMGFVRELLARRLQLSLEGQGERANAPGQAQAAGLTEVERVLRLLEIGSDRVGLATRAALLRSLSDDQLDDWLADQLQRLSPERA